MAIGRVGTFVSAYAANVSKTVTIGDLVVFFATGASGTWNTPTSSTIDTATTTAWTLVKSSTVKIAAGIWWAKVTASGTLKVTITGTATDIGCSLHEYSGANVTAPIDQTGSANGTVAAASVTLSSVANGSIMVLVTGEESSTTTWTATAPFTKQTDQSNHSHSTIDYIIPSGGNYTGTDTQASGPYGWEAEAATLLAASGTNYVLQCSAGSFAETGLNAILKSNLHILTSAGTFTETGSNANLKSNRKSYASTGVFTETGSNFIFLWKHALYTSAGVFVETGSSAILKSNLHVLASAGGFVLSGSNAILGKRAQLLASTGVFTETGNNATFKANLHILTSTGAFTETGLNATFLYNRKLFTATGAFAETGANLVFLFNHKLYTVAGIFALTGNIANLVYTPAAGQNYLLLTTAGIFVLTGCNVCLVYSNNSPAPLVPAGGMNIRKQVTMHPESMMTGHGFQPGGVTTRGNRWPGNMGSGKK